MESSSAKPGADRREPTAVARIATLFRLIDPTGQVLRCATYRVPSGTELRLEYEDREDVLTTELFAAAPDQEQALADEARQWRAAFDKIGGFEELAVI